MTVVSSPMKTADLSSKSTHTNTGTTNTILKKLLWVSTLLAPGTQVRLSAAEGLRSQATNQSLSPATPPASLTTSTTSIQAKVECPCIPLNATQLVNSNKYDTNRDCLIYREPGQTHCYPSSYGFEGCQPYDNGLPPSCNKEGFPGNPDWCIKSFCYVDKDNCNNTDHTPSSYFSNEGLHYSYDTCGTKNTFLQSLNNNLEHSIMEPAASLERSVISISETIGSTTESIRAFIKDGGAIEQSCSASNSCNPPLEGQHNDCWGGEVDFKNINVVLHQNRAEQAIPSDIDFLNCLSRPLKKTFLNVAETEHRDTNRTAYLFYGDQKTGGLISYPEINFCSTEYDARFRPWYASAVSGPKDVVVVIDNSGSMDNGNNRYGRLSLAEEATKRVIDTLTWADRVSLITFNGNVAKVFSEKLVSTDETTIDRIKSWVDSNFVANGGTDFMAPLEKGYEILNRNKDSNDQKTCSQAILFLTDGDADFDEQRMSQLVASNQDVVVFSYGLSADANQEPLQKMSCMTNGIYYPVRNEKELPHMMSSYYEYYAMLQDPGISYTRYTDAFSGKEMITGCLANYQYDQDGLLPADLAGVACVDLNIYVDPDTLKSCSNNAYGQFINQIFREATQCRTKESRLDTCELQNMRSRIHPDSVCTDQIAPGECEFGEQPTGPNYKTNSERFEWIPLEGCTIQTYNCDEEDPTKPNHKNNDSKDGLHPGVIGGIAVAGIAVLGGIYCCIRQSKRENNNTTGSNQYGSYPTPMPPPIAPSAPDYREDYPY